MYNNFPILSSADGYLGCLHILAIINSAAIESVSNLSREARGSQVIGENKLQVADTFPFSFDDIWFHLNLPFRKPWPTNAFLLWKCFT